MSLQMSKSIMECRSNETMRISSILPFTDAEYALRVYKKEKNKKIIKKQLWRQKSRFTTA